MTDKVLEDWKSKDISHLKGAQLCDFSYSDFAKGKIEGLTSDSVFRHCDISSVKAKSSKFENCVFSFCDFSESAFNNAEFKGCIFVGCYFTNAELQHVKFEECVIRSVVAMNTNFTHVKFLKCNVMGAFPRSKFSGAVATNCKVGKCVTSGVTYFPFSNSGVWDVNKG